jgi:parallel beta-helix repeat protein
MSGLIDGMNAFAQSWATVMLRASIGGSIALLLAWCILSFRPTTTGRVRCWWWRLAYLKLLVGLLAIASIALPLLPAPASMSLTSPATSHEPLLSSRSPSSIATFVELPTAPRAILASSVAHRFVPFIYPTWQTCLLLAWLSGVALCFAQLILAHRQMQRLRKYSVPCDDSFLHQTCVVLCERLNLQRVPPILHHADLPSPLLAGIRNPAIFLPTNLSRSCTRETVRVILAHELAHLRRRDLWWNALHAITNSLFFFNPLLWLARREWLLAQEIACDELAITAATSTPMAYGRSLLEMIAQGRNTPHTAFAVGIITFAGTTKRRIQAMGHFHASSRRQLFAAITAAAVAATIGLLPWRVVAQSPAPATAPNALNVGPHELYTTIQAAIDAAPPNALIHIAPGTYPEFLTVHKPLILEGAGWDQTHITPHFPTADDISKLTGNVDQLNNGQRQKIYDAALKDVPTAGVLIDTSAHVEFRNLQLSADPGPRNETPYSPSLLQLDHANASILRCALVGSPRNVLTIRNGTTADIRSSLISAAWDTGIVIGDHDGLRVHVTVADSDIRNCYYAGITISSTEDATIERCRISGAAWHGIRYDDASPTIRGNRIFANARCGIYASGRTDATVTDNLFTHNEMDGVSCWFGNHDSIVGKNAIHIRGCVQMVIVG